MIKELGQLIKYIYVKAVGIFPIAFIIYKKGIMIIMRE